MVTFCLVLPDMDGVIVDSAVSPGELDFSKAYPQSYFEVCARYEGSRNAGGPCVCIARVNLTGSKDYDKDFAWAIREVRAELDYRDEYGDFDDPEFQSDGPVIDLGYDCSCDCRGKSCDPDAGLCEKCITGGCTMCRNIHDTPKSEGDDGSGV